MIVNNTIKRVIVFKAIGQPPLRLFPGHNNTGEGDLSAYTEGNAVAQSRFDSDDLKPVSLANVNKKEAKAAKDKNDLLNKSSFALKLTQKKLVDAAAKIDSDKGEIAELKKQINKLEKLVAKSLSDDSGKKEFKSDPKVHSNSNESKTEA